DGGVLTDLDGVVRSPMQDDAVLDVRSAAHDDGGEVSAEDRSVPHRRVRLYDYAANECCGRGHESRTVDLGTVTLEFQLCALLVPLPLLAPRGLTASHGTSESQTAASVKDLTQHALPGHHGTPPSIPSFHGGISRRPGGRGRGRALGRGPRGRRRGPAALAGDRQAGLMLAFRWKTLSGS